MSEYGRGPGSEPWHPEDPLYGDGGWEGQQAHTGHEPAYGARQHYPQQSQQGYGDWSQDQQQYDPQYPSAYAQQQYPGQQEYPGQDQQQYPGQQQYVPQGGQQPYQQGGWDGTGTHAHVPYAADPGDPYGQQPGAYGAEQPDLYQTPDAYPPPEPPARRRTEPEPEETDWDPGPDQGEHAFFAGGDQDDEDDEDGDEPGGRRGRSERRSGKGARGGKGKSGKKRRSGCACLVVLLVFGGGLGGVGYVGYKFYQNRYGSAPDYAGDGIAQTVSVEIPKGAGGAEIGRRLKEAGVVKSVDAFVSALAQNPQSGSIQAGAYIMRKQMSAASAVKMMLDPKSQANVMVTPGERNAQVYKAIDAKLGLSSGATQKVAEAQYKSLGLPSWANDNEDIKDPLEGFLFPGTYPAAQGMKPETVLKGMVSHAAAKYQQYDVVAKAKALKLDSPLQFVTVASLVQAEGKTTNDFRRMAEVVYNRLDPANHETYGALQFDSTYNYAKGQSNIDVSEKEVKSNDDPYNTYRHKGLPPGPIGNPGDDAITSALTPTHDGWYYFVAVDGVSKTEFAKTHAEFLTLKDKFNESRGN